MTLNKNYLDGRPSAKYQLLADDSGIVLNYGDGPDNCDINGAREAIIYEEDGLYHLFYDGAGSAGWLACLATSVDLKHWTKHGPVLDFGKAGMPDSASASAPWVIRHDDWWHMFYLGTPNTYPAPDFVPSFPYLTLKARARKLRGPWEKQYDVTPWQLNEKSWYSETGSPGFVIKHNGEFIQYMSGSSAKPGYEGLAASSMPHNAVHRTVGIARTKNLNDEWCVDEQPIVPLEEQIENSSLYFEPANDTWFLFTNHIGISEENGEPIEYTDAIWVYWTKDPLKWDKQKKAIVMDGSNCSWSDKCIGMPGVIKHKERLAILYDAAGGKSISHMRRNIGLAWLELPLQPPGIPSD